MAATVATGKTDSRFTRLLVNGNNLSGDSRTMSGVGFTSALVDVTAWVDITENLKGVKTVMFGAYNAFYSNTIAAPSINAGTHTVLSPELNDFNGTLVIGVGGNPAIGASAFSSSLTQFDYLADATISSAVAINVNFGAGQNAVAGWGQMLSVGASESATIDLTSLDNGGANANGYMWFYHVSQSDGAMGANDWDLTIEDSANDSSFAATGATVSSIGATITSGLLTDTNSVDRYTRVSLTKTAGTDLILWVAQIPL